MKRYKLTKENKRQIAIAVKGLPNIDVVTSDPLKGSSYCHVGVVNHQKRAEREAEQGGVLALTAYVTAVLDAADHLRKENEKNAFKSN